MMRFHSALTAALATLIVAPAALQDSDLAILQNTLKKTDQALEILRDVHKRFATDAPGAGRVLLAATEPPAVDARWRDERLMHLRDEVSRLRSDLDQLQAPGVLPPIVTETPQGPQVQVPHDMPGTGPLSLSREEALRRSIESKPGNRNRAGLDPRNPEAAAPESAPTQRDLPPSPEGQDYSADPIGHARAFYRTGRYQDGLALLRGRKEPVAMYWRARCLEKLNRLQEAVTTLEQVIQEAPDSSEARRARTDLEFLKWKRSFVEKLPKGMKGGTNQ